jgi:hypothetical protein
MFGCFHSRSWRSANRRDLPLRRSPVTIEIYVASPDGQLALPWPAGRPLCSPHRRRETCYPRTSPRWSSSLRRLRSTVSCGADVGDNIVGAPARPGRRRQTGTDGTGPARRHRSLPSVQHASSRASNNYTLAAFEILDHTGQVGIVYHADRTVCCLTGNLRPVTISPPEHVRR